MILTPIAEYHYNGLGQRTMWRYDANANATVASTERYHYMYDGPAGGVQSWRMVGVFRDADSTPKESFVYHAAGNAGRGSSSYIDSVILRDRDANGGGGWTGAADGTLEERRYYVQNWRADVVAMTKSDGNPLEYVFYSAYGEATVHPIADVDMDGDVDSYDAAAWDNGENLGLAYNYVPANVDLNWDGTEDAADDALFDESYAANVGLSGKGRVSSAGVGNRKGYAGYEHDESIAMYHVRHRVYRPDLGRWMTRDPLGYVDGMGLYEYVGGMALVGRDPSGLARAVCPGGRCGGTIDDITAPPMSWLPMPGTPLGPLPSLIPAPTQPPPQSWCTCTWTAGATTREYKGEGTSITSTCKCFVRECTTYTGKCSGTFCFSTKQTIKRCGDEVGAGWTNGRTATCDCNCQCGKGWV